METASQDFQHVTPDAIDKPVFTVDSAVSSCNGNEPGTQKEVVSFKTGSSAYILNGSPDVQAEGKAVVYTTSSGMGNQM